MSEAGLQNILVKTAALPYRLPNFDEYWSMITTLGARAVLEKLTEAEIAETRKRLKPAIERVAGVDGSITIAMDGLFAFGETS
jgi:hypothetical protein